MKNAVKQVREAKNLTQNQLAEMSGLSLRTIQRIEAGQVLKGHTLSTLAETLKVQESDLLDSKSGVDLAGIKWINLSTLSFFLIPFGNLIFPLYLTYKAKSVKVKEFGKQILVIQVIWFVLFSLVLMLAPIIQSALGTDMPLVFPIIFVFVLLNLAIVIANAIQLDKKGGLAIDLKIKLL